MDKLIRYLMIAALTPVAFVTATVFNTVIVAMLVIAVTVLFATAIGMLIVGVIAGPFVFTYGIISELINRYDSKT